MSNIAFPEDLTQAPVADTYEAPKTRTNNKNSLDSEKNRKVHQRIMEWWTQAREIESINRYQQSVDADFYDGLQWSDEDAQELIARGQAPLVYNRIKPAMDWIIGTEKRSRFDFKVQARRDEECEAAEAKTALLKYLSDVNKTNFSRSRAFADAVTVGVGWLEDGIRSDTTDEPLFSRYETWRNIWYDPLSVERDLSDARYIFRSKYVDIDIAKAMFPNRVRTLESAAIQASQIGIDRDDEDYLGSFTQQRDMRGEVMHRRSYASSGLIHNRRIRVRLIECWFREPVTKKRIRGAGYNGVDYDPQNPEHAQAVEFEYASVYDAIVMQVRCAVMTTDAFLTLADSPYIHNKFPFTPIWGFRRQRDNAPYGAVRNIRDPQENLNKRMSKALHILSTNKIIADIDAATNWDDIREEAARPDGIILLDGRRDARFETDVDKGLAQEHVNLMEVDKQMIQDVSGITDENMGHASNATSGRAVTARQEQGSVITTEYFDNMRYAMQTQGEIQLSLIEQYYPHSKVIRILGDNNQPEFMSLNKPTINQQTGQVEMLNDITNTIADFIIDESEFRATQRAAMFDMFSELFKSLPPEITIKLMDLMFEYSDLPGREEIVTRIRKINGESDPKKKNDPEEVARAQQQQQQEAQQQQNDQMRVQLELQKLQADIAKTTADTGKVKADMVATNVTALYQGIQVGAQIAVLPAAASLGDAVVASAGYIDQNEGPIYPSTVTMGPKEKELIHGQLGGGADNNVSTPNKPKTAGAGKKAGIKKPGAQ